VVKLLRIPTIRDAMRDRGLNQSKVAAEIGVTREAVSNWLKNEDFPKADKLLKLGTLLGLGFKELVEERYDDLEPVVAFRRKGGHKTTEKHIEKALHMGRLLKQLAPLLPFDQLSRPATLKNPVNQYDYLQQVARKIRAEIGVAEDAPVGFVHLIGRFSLLQAVIVPVFLGEREHHENALHVYLPDSMSTWVFLNLDSNIGDFLFWMAHGYGHALAPEMRGDEAEDFADAFAQALLLPEKCAKDAYVTLSRSRSDGARNNRIKELAERFGISPTTVKLAVQEYALAHKLPAVDAGKANYAASTNFNKKFPTVTQNLLPQSPPSPKEYISVTKEVFQSPFFDALQRLIKEGKATLGYVETILQLPLLDSKSIFEELR